MQANDSGETIPVGPHEFVAEVEIERAASEVYALIDLADPRNSSRQLGDRVEEAAGQPGRFDLIVSELPDAVFALTVTQRKPSTEYAYSCVSSELFGHMLRSHEHYAIEELGDACCRLVLTNAVEFDRPLSREEYEIEAIMQAIAGARALHKIKVHAEEGTEAVEAMSAGLDFDINEDDSDA